MMKKFLSATLLLFALYSVIVHSQDITIEKGLNSINSDVIKSQMGFLASDLTEGREAGEKGEYIAAEYIASILGLEGIKPAGDIAPNSGTQNPATPVRSYFQNFSLIKSSPGNDLLMEIKISDGNTTQTLELSYINDFVIRMLNQSCESEAPVVFAGYGFKSKQLNFNDFEGLDLKGKFVLKISGAPAFASKNLSAADFTAALQESEKYIKDQGAIGIIDFRPGTKFAGTSGEISFLNASPSEKKPSNGKSVAKYSLPTNLIPDSFLYVTISSRVANILLSGSQINIDDYIINSDFGKKYINTDLIKKSVHINAAIVSTIIPVRNILGTIEGKNTNEIIVVGAHYDHLGKGNGYIWNGADDNASGTVAVMTLARAVVATGVKPEKTIVFALWTAEEEGLLGSRYYTRNLTYPLKNLKLNINFDMISRYISEDNNKGVVMTYTKTYANFRKAAENSQKKYNIDLNIDYQPSDDPPGGTDHRSFVEINVPVIRFKPGHREEYHTPFDSLETIDWDIMEKIIKINFTTLWELANSSW